MKMEGSTRVNFRRDCSMERGPSSGQMAQAIPGSLSRGRCMARENSSDHRAASKSAMRVTGKMTKCMETAYLIGRTGAIQQNSNMT